MNGADDLLARIVARKREEVRRRLLHNRLAAPRARVGLPPIPAHAVVGALRRRPGAVPRVIAEIKHRSPTAGVLRPRAVGGVASTARAYEAAGAAAVSVLVDRPGFDGSVLDVRRVARCVQIPVLFKEFVLDPVQLDLAAAAGASLVLLLARVLGDEEILVLADGCVARGLVPLLEVADETELRRAAALDVPIVGVNARDLRTFEVDAALARRLVEKVPADRVAVYMSGVRTRQDLDAVAATRADAVLVGEALMRAADPGVMLRELLA
jgi:indole-3-glycerol phosphate synthase